MVSVREVFLFLSTTAVLRSVHSCTCKQTAEMMNIDSAAISIYTPVHHSHTSRALQTRELQMNDGSPVGLGSQILIQQILHAWPDGHGVVRRAWRLYDHHRDSRGSILTMILTPLLVQTCRRHVRRLHNG